MDRNGEFLTDGFSSGHTATAAVLLAAALVLRVLVGNRRPVRVLIWLTTAWLTIQILSEPVFFQARQEILGLRRLIQ
jgi:hypothetical protein